MTYRMLVSNLQNLQEHVWIFKLYWLKEIKTKELTQTEDFTLWSSKALISEDGAADCRVVQDSILGDYANRWNSIKPYI